jgi:hypothetical protein
VTAEATLEGVAVRDIAPRALDGGAGQGIAFTSWEEAPAIGVIHGSLVERTYVAGVTATGSLATMTGLAVRDIFPNAITGLYGDGIGVARAFGPASAEIDSTVVANSARGGLAAFGAEVQLAQSTAMCNAFDISTEHLNGQDGRIVDLGDNRCGCPEPEPSCKAVSVGLTPPEPISPDR